MLRAYKYRIYPTAEQHELLAKHFGCVRLIYNLALEAKQMAYSGSKINVSRYDLQVQVKELKQDYEWLKEVNAQSLQASLLHLDTAYKNFFKNGSGFPKFKNKNNRQSFSCPGNKRELDFEKGLLYIPKFKEGIPINLTRNFKGNIKTVTISKTPTNKYYASILVDTEQVMPLLPVIKENTTVGIDLGLKHLVITSEGIKIDNPHFLRNELQRLKVLQRRASKKVKGSNSRKKANKKVARQHEIISNKRLDILHKLSHMLTHDNQVETICVESLCVSNLVMNHNLAQAITDVSWSKFKELLKYKCDWYGKNMIEIGMFEASSKCCNFCGYKNEGLTLSEREWRCINCGVTHDRDVNAAINIKYMGLTTGGASSKEPVERFAIARAMKQEKTNRTEESLCFGT